MKYYFALQQKIIKRHIEELGLPLWAAVVIAIGLIGILYSAAHKHPQYIGYTLPYLQLALLLTNSNARRILFLRATFTKTQFRKIRLIETTVISTPFILIALITQLWWSVAIVLCIIPVFTFWNGTELNKRPVPTPFSKAPFEFILLFRKYWLLYLLLFAVGIIGVSVGNFNLAMVMLVLTAILGLNAYEEIEPHIILWNYNMSPDKFLKHKIYRGLLHNWIMVLPCSVAVIIGFPSLAFWVLIVWLCIPLLTILIILIKYAVYPRKMTLLEGVTLVTAMLIPVLSIALFPYYYKKALKNLEQQGL